MKGKARVVHFLTSSFDSRPGWASEAEEGVRCSKPSTGFAPAETRHASPYSRPLQASLCALGEAREGRVDPRPEERWSVDYQLMDQHVLAEHLASRCYRHPPLLLGRLKTSWVIKQEAFGERCGERLPQMASTQGERSRMD